MLPSPFFPNRPLLAIVALATALHLGATRLCSDPPPLSCPTGYRYSGNTCHACPVGTYYLSRTPYACHKCPKGTTAGPAAVGRLSCQRCARRHFSGFAGDRCRPCPVNTYANGEGYFECTPCPAGWVSRRGQEECLVCPVGNFLDDNNECSSCPPGTGSSTLNSKECTTCAKGSARSFRDGPCAECEPGYFAADQGQERCRFCPVKTYSSDRGATECTPCPPRAKAGGRNATHCFFDGDLAARNCAPGQGLPLGADKCQRCPAGTFSDSARATPCEQCTGNQIPNAARTGCECPPGARPVPWTCTRCELCPDGAAVVDGECKCQGDLLKRTIIFFQDQCVCPAGRKRQGTKCLPCSSADLAAGLCEVCRPYSGLDEKTGECAPCPDGTANNKYIFGKCPKCRAGINDGCGCPDGQIGLYAGAPCQKCPPGTFKSGWENCQTCYDNRYQPLAAQNTCRICPTGTSPSGNRTSCLPVCGPGKYREDDDICRCQDSQRVLAPDGTCQKCSRNGDQGDDQVPCQCDWSGGQFGIFPDCKRTQCPLGTFSVANSNGTETCVPCYAGDVARIPGRCTRCPHSVRPDPYITGATTCTPRRCPRIMSQFPDMQGKCTSCAPGTRLDYDQRKCVKCPAGAVSPGGAAACCSKCRKGLEPDAQGRRCVNAGTAQMLCPAGSFVNGDGACVQCEAGSFSNMPNATQCTKCARGKFNGRKGLTKCFFCNNGGVTTGTGATKCTPCSDGSVPNQQRTECVPV